MSKLRTKAQELSPRDKKLPYVKFGIIFGSLAILLFIIIVSVQFYSAYEVKDTYARRFLHMPRRLSDAEWHVFTDTKTAEPLLCAQVLGERTMVALIMGQSNAANTVEILYRPHQAVYMYYDHACYKAADPLLGASDLLGSSWTRLGDKLIERGLYDKVLLVSIARSGSSVLNWGRYGDLPTLFRKTIRNLKADGISVTHVFFHQGEADCPVGMSREDYRVVLASFIRQLRFALGEKPAIFISQASRYRKYDCPDNADPNSFATCPAITGAQADAVDESRRVYAGPNTDMVVPYDQRPDGYHFSAAGAEAFAEAWLPILARQRQNE
jgi:lysophospholipase L1-like esterase